MIKTPDFFVTPFLENIKIRNEFIKRISMIKQKLIVILFWSSFLWHTQNSQTYTNSLSAFASLHKPNGSLLEI